MGGLGPPSGEKTALATKTECRFKGVRKEGKELKGLFGQSKGQDKPLTVFFFFPLVTPFCPMDVTFLSFSPSLSLPFFFGGFGEGKQAEGGGKRLFFT